MSEYTNEMIEKFTRADGRWNSVAIKHIQPDVLSELKYLTNFLSSDQFTVTTRLVALRDGLVSAPTCEHCGAPIYTLSGRSFKRFCGPKCHTQTPEFKQSQQTRNNSMANERRSKTMIEKYGVAHNLQRDSVKDKLKTPKIQVNKLELLSNRDLLYDLHINQKKSGVQIGAIFDVGYGTVIEWIRKHGIEFTNYKNTSQFEDTIESILIESNLHYIKNDRTIIAPKEIDFYIPEKKLAIEVNGVYWHSEGKGKNHSYHIEKTKQCQQKNITLLQFWDSEIRNQFDIISSMIRSRLGISKHRVFARNCTFTIPSIEQEKEFLNENHRQGWTKSAASIALDYNGQLVAVMSFGKPRFSKTYEWELLRFATKQDHSIIGGASKLFKHAPVGSMISYADKRYSTGNLYKLLGFEWIRDSAPGYYYTSDFNTLIHRVKFQKHKLKTSLETYDENKTEWENMKIAGYDRVWDCGQSVWVKE